MNKVFLSGRLTRDVECRETASGMAWARTGIAVDRRSKEKAVDYFNLAAWDKTAKVMGKYLSKGSKIFVEGHLQFSQYEDKNGTKKTSVDVIVETFEFMDSKGSKKPANAVGDGFGGEPINPDDTPF